MPRYSYKGKSVAGKAVEGELEAENLGAAHALVKKRRIKDATVRKAGGGGFQIGTGIGLKDLSRFTRQFSAMN